MSEDVLDLELPICDPHHHLCPEDFRVREAYVAEPGAGRRPRGDERWRRMMLDSRRPIDGGLDDCSTLRSSFKRMRSDGSGSERTGLFYGTARACTASATHEPVAT